MSVNPEDFVIEGVPSVEEQEHIASRPVTYGLDAWRRFRRLFCCWHWWG